MDRIFSIIQTLLALGFVILLAHMSLRLMNKYTRKQNRIIKVIERLGVNNNSALSIVEICGKYYLMSFTQNDNTILKELNESEMKEMISQIDLANDSLDNGFLDGFKNLSRKYKKTDTYWNEGKK